MELEAAIRGRRTHKAYGREPVDRATLEELFDLARWAPNHHLTNPWRFRVLGPAALARLKEAAGPEAAAKRDRAPTLVAVAATHTGGDAGLGDADRRGRGRRRGGRARRRGRRLHRPARRPRPRPGGVLADTRGAAHRRGPRGARRAARRADHRPAASRPAAPGARPARARADRRRRHVPRLTRAARPA